MESLGALPVWATITSILTWSRSGEVTQERDVGELSMPVR